MWEKIFWSDFWMYFNKKNNIFLKSRFVFWIWREGKGWAIFSIYIFDFWGKFPIKICWLGVSKNFFWAVTNTIYRRKIQFFQISGQIFWISRSRMSSRIFSGHRFGFYGKKYVRKVICNSEIFFLLSIGAASAISKNRNFASTD